MLPYGERVALGEFVVDAARRELLRDGRAISINGKTFDLLLVFIESRGAVVTREALFERLWPGADVEEANLSQNIYLLRKALDPTGDGREYIETLPRYGYRLLKAVRVLPAPHRRTGIWVRPAMVAALLFIVGLGGPQLRMQNAPLSEHAREAYALGVYNLSLRAPNELAYARTYFEQTVRESPNSAEGYAVLATATALSAEFEPDRSEAQRAMVRSAERMCDDALRRDARNVQALAVSGFLAYRFQRQPAVAETYFRRAIANDDANVDAHHWHGALLLAQGRIDAAITELEAAHRLQPTSEVILRWLARAYTYARKPNGAIRVGTRQFGFAGTMRLHGLRSHVHKNSNIAYVMQLRHWIRCNASHPLNGGTSSPTARGCSCCFMPRIARKPRRESTGSRRGAMSTRLKQRCFIALRASIHERSECWRCFRRRALSRKWNGTTRVSGDRVTRFLKAPLVRDVRCVAPNRRPFR